MPKISPKSASNQNAQNIKPSNMKREGSDSEMPFAAIFGGLRSELLHKRVKPEEIASTPMKTIKSAVNRAFEEGSNEDLSKSDQFTKNTDGLDQINLVKTSSNLSNDHSISATKSKLDEDGFDEAGLLQVSLPVLNDFTESGKPLSRNSRDIMGKIPFDKTVVQSPQVDNRIESLQRGKGLLSKEIAEIQHSNSSLTGKEGGKVDLGLNNARLSEQSRPSNDFIGPMPLKRASGHSVDAMADLRALKVANLRQTNMEIDEENADKETIDLMKNSQKKTTNGDSFKQKEFSDKNIAITAKILTREDKGQGTGETIRPKMVSSASFEGSSTNSTGAGNSTFNGQTGGQSSGGQPQLGTGGGLLNNLNVLQSLDMAKDNWTEMLLQRVQKGLSGGKDQLDFQLNPRNLGKMRISLMVQNDRTHVKIQTETSAAASMLNDSEARLAQMLESSGLRLGNLNSEHFNGFGSNGFNQNDAKQNQSEMSANAESSKETDNSDNVTETIEERSKNLVNIQA